MDLMVELNKQNDQTFVWVTHSEEVGALAKRLIRMRDGHITSDTAGAAALASTDGFAATSPRGGEVKVP
jgi:ABC-type lipoprotein export system ATPase subunit